MYTFYIGDKKLSYTAEIARVGGHYAVQGHSRSLILILIKSLYSISVLTYSYLAPFSSYCALQCLSNYRHWQRGSR